MITERNPSIQQKHMHMEQIKNIKKKINESI